MLLRCWHSNPHAAMNDCIIQDGACVQCGWQWSGVPGVRRNCPASIPVRSEAEQAALAAVCRECPEFDGDGCKKCGCPSSRKAALESKLRIGDCPLNKWPKR